MPPVDLSHPRSSCQLPNLLLASGKAGTVYVINRDKMGHFHQRSDNIVQELPKAITASYDTPAYFDNTVYYAGVDDALKSFALVNGQLIQTGQRRILFLTRVQTLWFRRMARRMASFG